MRANYILILAVLVFGALSSCKTVEIDQYSQILESKDVVVIENFLKNSDNSDPRRFVLKSRLIALKNAELKKNTDKARQLVSTPKFTEIPKNYRSNSAEAAEFQSLMQEKSTGEH